MDNFHLKIMEILSGLAKYDYFKHTPEITEKSIKESAAKLLEIDKAELSSPNTLKKKAREVLQKTFFKNKHNAIASEILTKVNDYYEEYTTLKLKKVSDVERDNIRIKAYERFVKYFDLSKDNWEYFAKKALINEINDECNPEKNKERFPNYLSQYDKADDENAYKSLPEELIISEIPAEKDMKYIGMWDTVRDMIISGKISAKKDKNLLYPCFFTDNISAFIEINPNVLKHVKEKEKQYNNAVDIDFLNYFVDGKCDTITDSCDKPRKPLSHFKPEGSDEPCSQPLEQIVFASYKNVSLSTVSNSLKLYRMGLAAVFMDY